ncbi:MAG: ABC transporter ATP-binding protein [Candidatus Nanopelagicales bacterium]|nr:ABC transporter ATP-binding protein [Candidatus Nanopelagicales bacterium]
MSPAIEVDCLHKAYGDVVAVDEVSFTVEHGECLALLGPNGAGKTTTTEILEGYRKADSGSARVLGVDPAKGDLTWKARLGIVLQADRDLGDLTVRETVSHFADYFPDSRDPDEVIAAVGLTEKAKARNGKLSGGQRRRLDVALGILGRPEVLFLDEPTTGFDPAARRDFWTLIEQLKAEGTTILLTTHYLEEAERLADRVAVIARGRIVACDAPGRIGNRADAQAIVSWREGDIDLTEATSEPTEFVRALAERFAGEIPALQVHRPTLEEIYLSLLKMEEER